MVSKTGPTGSPATDAIAWEADIPLLTSRFMWWDLLKVSVLSSLIMWVLVAFTGWIVEGEPAILPWWVVLIAFSALLGLFVIASLLLGNRHRALFEVSETGVSYGSGTREKRVNTAVVVLGALAGSAGTAGAGLLAKGQESAAWKWSDIHQARAYAGPRVVSLRNSWRVVLRLHVPVELWDSVVALCERRVAEEREKRAAVAPRVSTRPLWSRAAWALGCVGFSVAMQAWYWIETDVEVLTRVGFVGGLVVALAAALEGPARRILGIFGGLGLLAQVWALAVSALDPIESAFGTSLSATLDTPYLVLAAGSTAALLGVAAWRVFGRE